MFWLGLGLALVSALAVNWAYSQEHDAAAALPPLTLREPIASARLLLGSRDWLLGFGVESAGWIVYVAALRIAPLSLVQAVSAAGIGVLALASARRSHRRDSAASWRGGDHRVRRPAAPRAVAARCAPGRPHSGRARRRHLARRLRRGRAAGAPRVAVGAGGAVRSCRRPPVRGRRHVGEARRLRQLVAAGSDPTRRLPTVSARACSRAASSAAAR